MSNIPAALAYGKRSIRMVVINGIPKFSATDICNILGYIKANKILGRYCDSTPEYIRLHTPGGVQSLRMIEKSDIESILSHSKRRTVPRVRKWLSELYGTDADKEV